MSKERRLPALIQKAISLRYGSESERVLEDTGRLRVEICDHLIRVFYSQFHLQFLTPGDWFVSVSMGDGNEKVSVTARTIPEKTEFSDKGKLGFEVRVEGIPYFLKVIRDNTVSVNVCMINDSNLDHPARFEELYEWRELIDEFRLQHFVSEGFFRSLEH